jgi:hypothetical protein
MLFCEAYSLRSVMLLLSAILSAWDTTNSFKSFMSFWSFKEQKKKFKKETDDEK